MRARSPTRRIGISSLVRLFAVRGAALVAAAAWLWASAGSAVHDLGAGAAAAGVKPPPPSEFNPQQRGLDRRGDVAVPLGMAT